MTIQPDSFIQAIGPRGPEIPQVASPFSQPADTTSFKDMLKRYIDDVNAMQQNANDSISKLATGEIKDVHQVMTAAAEAEISFKMMMEIRSKLIAAYQELIKTNL